VSSPQVGCLRHSTVDGCDDNGYRCRRRYAAHAHPATTRCSSRPTRGASTTNDATTLQWRVTVEKSRQHPTLAQRTSSAPCVCAAEATTSLHWRRAYKNDDETRLRPVWEAARRKDEPRKRRQVDVGACAHPWRRSAAVRAIPAAPTPCSVPAVSSSTTRNTQRTGMRRIAERKRCYTSALAGRAAMDTGARNPPGGAVRRPANAPSLCCQSRRPGEPRLTLGDCCTCAPACRYSHCVAKYGESVARARVVVSYCRWWSV